MYYLCPRMDRPLSLSLLSRHLGTLAHHMPARQGGAPVCVAYMDVGQGREQDAEALLVVYLE